jgi:hypothetical protein
MIGGEHFLPVPASVDHSLGQLLESELGRVGFFATGRDALATLLTSLRAPLIHLPDLMCASVHNACHAAGKERAIYRIGTDYLHEPGVDEGWTTPSIVFAMHYFGIRDDVLMQRARAAGHTVVSDVTHLLFDADGLRETARQSDYLIASLRKSGPFPDGGFVSSLAHATVAPKRGPRNDFFALRAAGLISRGFSAAHDFNNDENFLLLKQAEEELDDSGPGDFGCSYLSRQLARTVSVADSSRAIRRNVAVLRDGLRNRCWVPDRDLVSPYFPCLFSSRGQRDRVRAALAAGRFFFPVHWPATGMSSPSQLAERGLSVPCDARYGEPHMRAALEVIQSCLPR